MNWFMKFILNCVYVKGTIRDISNLPLPCLEIEGFLMIKPTQEEVYQADMGLSQYNPQYSMNQSSYNGFGSSVLL
jgi:hypothetical protein